MDFKVIRLYKDNQSSFNFTENPEFYQKIKYIDIKHHFIRKYVANKTVDLYYVASADMTADDLIKLLIIINHIKFIKFLKIKIIKIN